MKGFDEIMIGLRWQKTHTILQDEEVDVDTTRIEIPLSGSPPISLQWVPASVGRLGLHKSVPCCPDGSARPSIRETRKRALFLASSLELIGP